MLVSIVIPVRNAEAYLNSCLSQIKDQDYPHEWIEVIVVDGASTDHTLEIAETTDIGGISRTVIKLSQTGRSQGLNAGIRAAHGDAICRLDVRTRIECDYISRCVQTARRTGAANVGGLQLPAGTTATQQAIGLAMGHPFGVGNAQFRIGKTSGYVDTVYLGFFRRSIFDKVGYFDESASVISEDSDMNQRIRESGEKVYLDVNIRCYYTPRSTLAEQFQLYYRYGGARAANVLKHRKFTSIRQLAAPVLVAALAFGVITAPFWPIISAPFLGLIALYLMIDLVIATRLALREGNFNTLPGLILAFPCMHLAWGSGFWRRLLIPDTGAQWKG